MPLIISFFPKIKHVINVHKTLFSYTLFILIWELKMFKMKYIHTINMHEYKLFLNLHSSVDDLPTFTPFFLMMKKITN